MVKNPPANAGNIRDAGSIPGLGRSPGGGHSNPLKYSCLENSMDSPLSPFHKIKTNVTRILHRAREKTFTTILSISHTHIHKIFWSKEEELRQIILKALQPSSYRIQGALTIGAQCTRKVVVSFRRRIQCRVNQNVFRRETGELLTVSASPSKYTHLYIISIFLFKNQQPCMDEPRACYTE